MSLSSSLQMVFEFMHRLDRVIFFMRMITALNIIPWMMWKVMIMDGNEEDHPFEVLVEVTASSAVQCCATVLSGGGGYGRRRHREMVEAGTAANVLD